jgi:hypothetical protein
MLVTAIGVAAQLSDADRVAVAFGYNEPLPLQVGWVQPLLPHRCGDCRLIVRACPPDHWCLHAAIIPGRADGFVRDRWMTPLSICATSAVIGCPAARAAERDQPGNAARARDPSICVKSRLAAEVSDGSVRRSTDYRIQPKAARRHPGPLTGPRLTSKSAKAPMRDAGRPSKGQPQGRLRARG